MTVECDEFKATLVIFHYQFTVSVKFGQWAVKTKFYMKQMQTFSFGLRAWIWASKAQVGLKGSWHKKYDSPTERIITLRITSERITSERINTERITSERITSERIKLPNV